MDIEDVLSSKTRIKILKLLDQKGQRHISDIARRIKINYTAADKHLRLLESEGILIEYTYGVRFRMYRLNETSEKAEIIQNLIHLWEQNKQPNRSERNNK
ncbi:MAG: winged helix-turn-helix domain-containing protein [Nitrososphaerota archaeon]|jgi:DNA-binding transcriptional ArsR family regulator|nr:winged helix-turn-helix domain-containing protein [Nitrososphaerota archaeon]